MSWSSYVENLTKAGLKSAAVIGQNGQIWAKSDNFPNITAQEIESFKKGFSEDPRTAPSPLTAQGATLGGTKYACLTADQECINLKQKLSEQEKASQDANPLGVFVMRTPKTLLVGIHDKHMQGGAAKTAVGKIRDYLISVNF